MTDLTDYAENKLADFFYRSAVFAKVTEINFRLFTAAPGESGGGTEVSGAGYAAVNLPPLDTNYNGTHGTTTGVSSGTGGQIDNAVAIQFGAPTANWGIVTHMAWDDEAANMMMYGDVVPDKTVNNGDPAPNFPIGNFTSTFS